MLWNGATISASFGFGDTPRSLCLRFLLGLFLPINVLIWSIVVLPLASHPVSSTLIRHEDDLHWLSHPRAPLLCGRTFSGLEGTPIKGFARDRVFVMTTPGLTFHQNVDSLLSLQGRSDSHCHFQKFAKLHSSQKIKSYPEALQMKDKVFEKFKPASDFKLFKHVPHSINCQDEMLTPQGVAQGIQLGEYLAKSYFKSLNTLPHSSFSAKGFAYSIGDELLYQSVHAVLYGMLDEKQFVYAGVKKLSHHFTDDKTSQVDFQGHLDHFVKTAFANEHHLFKDVSSPTGNRWEIDSEFGWDLTAKKILSSISLKECDKPENGAAHLSSDLIDAILSVSDVHNAYLLNSSVFLNYSKSVSLPFRKFLNTWLSSLHKGNDFKLVSVDELFVLSLLNVLGVDSVEHIPPMSRLVIEQFRFQSSSPINPSHLLAQNRNDYTSEYSIADPRDVFFRVLYNGEVITNSILHCRSDPLVSLGLCRLPSFVTSLMNEDAIRFKDEF